MSSTNNVVVTQRSNQVAVTQISYQVVVQTPGPQGIQGAEGPPGPAAASFEFTQAAPATPWVVNHSLNCYPSVTIIVGGEETDADVVYGSLNQVTISFGSPQSGVARLRP